MPVQDKERNPADNGRDLWAYSFGDIVATLSDAQVASLTYTDLFNRMKAVYHTTYSPRTPATDKTQ